MRAYHVAGFLALAFWQVAPVQEASRPGGPFRLGIAYATGEWEDATFGCGGGVQSSTAVPARSTGARLDYLGAEGRVRVTAAGGRWWIDRDTAGSSRTFAGFQLAFEDEDFGFGAGYVSRPFSGTDRSGAVSFYARLGDLRRPHLEGEITPLSETPALAGTVRVGVGFGKGLERQANGFMGVAWGPYSHQLGQGVLQAEVGIPLFRSLDVLVRGSVGLGAGSTTPWAAGGGLRAVW